MAMKSELAALYRKLIAAVVWTITICMPSAQGESLRPLLEPTRFHLSPENANATLDVFNNEEFPVAWSAQPYLWSQGIDGQDELGETNEIAILPASVHLRPHTGARLQVKYLGKNKFSHEKSFRVLLTSSLIEKDRLTVNYTHSLPLFVSNLNAIAHIKASLYAGSGGDLLLELGNQGDSHDFIENLAISGLRADGKVVFSRERQGWYVLSGKKAVYRVDINAADCRASATFVARIALRIGRSETMIASNTLNCENNDSIQTDFRSVGPSLVTPTSAFPQN